MVKKMIKEFVHNQTVDNSNVRAHQNFAKGKFFLVSCAGLIEYTPKNEKDVARFRDKWINRFEAIRVLDAKDQKAAFFRLFAEIRSSEKIRFKANLRTRAWYYAQLN